MTYCAYCGELITDADAAVSDALGRPVHRACFLRPPVTIEVNEHHDLTEDQFQLLAS